MRSIAALLFLFSASLSAGQTPDGQPAFEVASIKSSPPPSSGPIVFGAGGGPGTPDPERFTSQHLDLLTIITTAFSVKRYQVSGPPWLATARFDINAKLPAGATKEQFLLMLQNLLAERFQMKLHREKKEMPLYTLVAAKGGPKLKEAARLPEDTQAADGIVTAGPPKMDRDGYPVLPAGRAGAHVAVGPGGRARMQAQTVADLIVFLGGFMAAPVIDGTGLNGKYDITLTFGRDMEAMGRGMPMAPMPPPPGDDDVGPTLLTALQVQLGLRLETRRGPVEILVIDRIKETPTEN